MEECYNGYTIEIRESILGSFPETWAVRLRSCGWYWDMTCTYATKELALECAKARIDKWKEEDNAKQSEEDPE